MVDALNRAAKRHGNLDKIRVYNGPDLVCKEVNPWANASGVMFATTQITPEGDRLFLERGGYLR